MKHYSFDIYRMIKKELANISFIGISTCHSMKDGGKVFVVKLFGIEHVVTIRPVLSEVDVGKKSDMYCDDILEKGGL